jgi:hypothetical protein
MKSLRGQLRETVHIRQLSLPTVLKKLDRPLFALFAADTHLLSAASGVGQFTLATGTTKRNTLPRRTANLLAAALAISMGTSAVALDKNGNFESQQERDAFIASTLKKMAGEMNAQTPIQLDEDTRLMSVIALQKTITFNMRLPNYKSSQIDSKTIAQAVWENLNHTVCKSKATRDLIDVGVQYVYLYSGHDGKLVTRVVIDKYRC